MKTKAEAIDGYNKLSAFAKAPGTGPLSDPTLSAIIARESVPDVAWYYLITETLAAMDAEKRRLACEIWIDPVVQPNTAYRYRQIAGRMNISERTLYAWRDQFLFELGSRAYACGLVTYEQEEAVR